MKKEKKMIEIEEDEFYKEFYNSGDTFLIPITVKRMVGKNDTKTILRRTNKKNRRTSRL